jgi:hypothetical protein
MGTTCCDGEGCRDADDAFGTGLAGKGGRPLAEVSEERRAEYVAAAADGKGRIAELPGRLAGPGNEDDPVLEADRDRVRGNESWEWLCIAYERRSTMALRRCPSAVAALYGA